MGLCACFGDPHFMTFDGVAYTERWARTFWLVKSSSVQIQGLSITPDLGDGWFIGFAAAGDWMLGHTLVVAKWKNLKQIPKTYLELKDAPIRVYFDGKEILLHPGGD